MENLFENIDNYIDGSLSVADRAAFEEALLTDKKLADEVAFYQDLAKGIEVGADLNLKNSLKNVQNSLKNEGFFLTDTDIDAFIAGNLDDDKKAGFDTRLANDTDFASDVTMQKDLLKGIELGADNDLRDKIRGIHQNLDSEKFFEKQDHTAIIRPLNAENSAKIRRIGVQWWAAAASIALVIAAGFWLFNPAKPTTYDNIVTQYFQAESNRVKDVYSELSAEGFATDKLRNNSLKMALEAYQAKNYVTAKSLLAAHVVQFKDDFDAQFYLSMTYMSLHENTQAIPFLTNLLNNTGSGWMKEAKWHLALIYWNMPEKHDTAVLYLKGISADNSSLYQAQASEILKQ